MTLRSSIEFGALLVYSPSGTSKVSVRSRDICYRLKDGNDEVLRRSAELVSLDIKNEQVLAKYFGEDTTLTPAPRSSPLLDGQLWPAQRICSTFQEHGFAPHILPLLTRTSPVPKSAFAAPGERPTAYTHYETITAENQFVLTPNITVVDDVITKGSTLIAAVSKLSDVYPDKTVRGFAIIRTKGLVPEIRRILDPTTGTISFNGGSVQRDP